MYISVSRCLLYKKTNKAADFSVINSLKQKHIIIRHHFADNYQMFLFRRRLKIIRKCLVMHLPDLIRQPRDIFCIFRRRNQNFCILFISPNLRKSGRGFTPLPYILTPQCRNQLPRIDNHADTVTKIAGFQPDTPKFLRRQIRLDAPRQHKQPAFIRLKRKTRRRKPIRIQPDRTGNRSSAARKTPDAGIPRSSPPCGPGKPWRYPFCHRAY